LSVKFCSQRSAHETRRQKARILTKLGGERPVSRPYQAPEPPSECESLPPDEEPPSSELPPDDHESESESEECESDESEPDLRSDVDPDEECELDVRSRVEEEDE
jgi:hypothetical protein